MIFDIILYKNFYNVYRNRSRFNVICNEVLDVYDVGVFVTVL